MEVTATDATFPEGFYPAHFDVFVSSGTSKVIAGKIKALLARVSE